MHVQPFGLLSASICSSTYPRGPHATYVARMAPRDFSQRRFKVVPSVERRTISVLFKHHQVGQNLVEASSRTQSGTKMVDEPIAKLERLTTCYNECRERQKRSRITNSTAVYQSSSTTVSLEHAQMIQLNQSSQANELSRHLLPRLSVQLKESFKVKLSILTKRRSMSNNSFPITISNDRNRSWCQAITGSLSEILRQI